jgi:hypothetical protein
VPVSSVFPCDEFKDYFLHGQFQPNMVAIVANSTASRWVDVLSLVQSQDIDVTDAAGEVISDGFLSAVEKCSTPEEPLVAAWRWQVVAANEGSSLALQLQSLPASADALHALPVFR